MKRCTRCGDEKWDSHFGTSSTRGRTYLRSICKTCGYAAHLKRRAKMSPEALSARDRKCFLKHKYGITVEQYDALVHLQSGCCAICFRDCRDDHSGLVVDHNHDTGAVRALLCSGCNTGIGCLKESTEIMISAMKYLRTHAGK